MEAVNHGFLDEFEQWLSTKGYSRKTIRNYLIELRSIPGDVETYFSQDFAGKRNKIYPYRLYLKFLARKKKLLSREDLYDALDTFKPPKQRGNKRSDRKYRITRDQWGETIRKVNTPQGKFGAFLGFNFGLRLGEIIHLRVEDIDFVKKEILVRHHRKNEKKGTEAWTPKYARERQIPFTAEQAKILKRWIKNRPGNLQHPYLLWNNNLDRVTERVFQRYLDTAGVHPHVLRYSFATHYYYASDKDLKLVSELLGHANVRTTSGYLQLDREEVMDRARKVFES